MLRWRDLRRRLQLVPDDRELRTSILAIVMLVAALTPIVVAVERAIGTGSIPLFDAGYFTVRSRDVLTEHHPWLGAWSSGSVALGATVRNLGPLQLDLMAPFTKLDPYWGTAVGVGVVGVASVIAVWWVAHRVLGPLGASAAMLATLAFETTIGSQAFIDPRQQLFLLLPFWALLWLAWGTAVGEGAAAAPLVVAASLTIQTHFTYVVQATIIFAAAVAGYVVTARRGRRGRPAVRPWFIALAAGVVCWAQPLWDQVAGDRNLGAVFAHRNADPGVGWGDGTRIVASAVLMPPHFWLPGTMGAFDLPFDLRSLPSAVGATLVSFGLVGAAIIVAWRQRLWRLAALGAVAAVALIAALIAGARIPLSAFGAIPQNYLWLWPTAVFLTTAVVAVPLAAVASGRRARPIAAVATLAVALVAMAFASRPVNTFETVASERTAGERLGRPLVEQLAASLRQYDIRGPLEVDHTRSSFGNYMRYVFLAELQRAGIEFTFPAGDRNVDRFGKDRCEQGGAVGRILLADAGPGTAPRRGEVVLAYVDAFGAIGRAQLAALDRRFGDLLRAGTVELDLPNLVYLAGGEVPGLDRVLSSPGVPAIGLATTLAPWTQWGVVDVPDSLRRDFDRWVDLQTRSSLEDVVILLAPPRTEPPGKGLPVTHRFCPT